MGWVTSPTADRCPSTFRFLLFPPITVTPGSTVSVTPAGTATLLPPSSYPSRPVWGASVAPVTTDPPVIHTRSYSLPLKVLPVTRCTLSALTPTGLLLLFSNLQPVTVMVTALDGSVYSP